MTTERFLRLANNATTMQGLETKTDRIEEINGRVGETKTKKEFYLLGYNAV
jgi:hypothetical protein